MSIDSLRWIRVFTPDHIPKYLIEQIKHRDYTVEDFYQYHLSNCLIQSGKGVILNPFSHLYVLADETNVTKGVLWFCVDPLTKNLIIQTYSVDKSYWKRGEAVEKLSNHIKEIRKNGNLKKIYWVTNYPKHSQKYGFKPSKNVLMEYSEKGEMDDGEHTNGVDNSQGECRPTESGTAELS